MLHARQRVDRPLDERLGRRLSQQPDVARDFGSLVNILTSPFVHGNIDHLMGNALPEISRDVDCSVIREPVGVVVERESGEDLVDRQPNDVLILLPPRLFMAKAGAEPGLDADVARRHLGQGFGFGVHYQRFSNLLRR